MTDSNTERPLCLFAAMPVSGEGYSWEGAGMNKRGGDGLRLPTRGHSGVRHGRSEKGSESLTYQHTAVAEVPSRVSGGFRGWART